SLPCTNPTLSYWTVPHWGADSATVLQEADVVIIGSGINGASVARSLLRGNPKLEIVML
ncbi:hypothetical protein B0H13DRAFT_1632537, partial [Mycena leptocephala]